MFVLEGPDLDFSALFDEDSTKNVKLKVFGKGYPKGFNCHAVVISAQSNIFGDLIDGCGGMSMGSKLKKMKCIRLEKGIGGPAVKLFLRHAYFGNISLEDVESTVLLHLLKMSYIYEVRGLLGNVFESILIREPGLYSPDDLVELYCYVKDKPPLQELKQRSVELMTRTLRNVKVCPTFKELKMADPRTWLDLAMDVLIGEDPECASAG